jgi:arginyl-tRNA synthetase
MKSRIKQLVEKATREVFPEIFEALDFDVLIPPQPDFGDYSANVAMILAKTLKRNPMEIAKHIVEYLEKEEMFASVSVAPPGYVNMTLSQQTLSDIVVNTLASGSAFWWVRKLDKPDRVLVEFISANPTGPIHLGNARGGPAGDTLARVLEKTGSDVHREFYVNDFGKQIAILGHSVLKDDEAQYKGEYIDELAKKKPTDISEPFAVGQWAAREILETFIKSVCERVGISFDAFFSEKSLHTSGKVEAMKACLDAKKLTYEKDGAVWYRSSALGDEKDRVIIRTDGEPTYRLADFAYHQDKIDRGFDRMITFLGADHLGEAREMERFMEKILEKKGVYTPILTQFVRVVRDGKEVKMSKRRGTFYALDDLIDEVGRDAVRFIFLSYASNSHISFDIDIAKQQSEKNPVYSVQYAHARIASIVRKVGDVDSDVVDLSFLTHPKERELLVALLRFRDIVEDVRDSFETHRLPQYARELADIFHSFYNACRVIDEEYSERTASRLALVRATKITLADTLNLCGVSAPEKM